jgi:hypothetical protein
MNFAWVSEETVISLYREGRSDWMGGSMRRTRIVGYLTVPACPSDKNRLDAR